MTDQQLIHKANGVNRIRQAILACNELPTYNGTIYSDRFIIAEIELSAKDFKHFKGNLHKGKSIYFGN